MGPHARLAMLPHGLHARLTMLPHGLDSHVSKLLANLLTYLDTWSSLEAANTESAN